MSDGKPIPIKTALNTANSLVDRLRCVCERVELAGSIRRQQTYVHDIELVAIPKEQPDLFGLPVRSSTAIGDVLCDLGITWSKFVVNGPCNKRFWYEGLKVDLFITTPEKFGVIFLIRTGGEEFAKCMVTERQKGGMMPSYMKVHDGRVWNGREAMETPQEEDIFKLFGLKWIEPKDRK